MSDTMKKYGLMAAKAVLSLAFAAASLAKLSGVEMMVETFQTIGIGQWFRYAAALIELGGAILIWVPGMQFLGAGLLLCTMIGAVLAHMSILGPSAVPALILGLLAAIVAYSYRPSNS